MDPSKNSLSGGKTSLIKKSRHNIGGNDRMIRGVIGVSLMFTGLFVFEGVSLNHFGIFVMVLSLIPMVTSQMAICPVYRVFGISTRTAEDEAKEAEYEENYEKDYH